MRLSIEGANLELPGHILSPLARGIMVAPRGEIAALVGCGGEDIKSHLPARVAFPIDFIRDKKSTLPSVACPRLREKLPSVLGSSPLSTIAARIARFPCVTQIAF